MVLHIRRPVAATFGPHEQVWAPDAPTRGVRWKLAPQDEWRPDLHDGRGPPFEIFSEEPRRDGGVRVLAYQFLQHRFFEATARVDEVLSERSEPDTFGWDQQVVLRSHRTPAGDIGTLHRDVRDVVPTHRFPVLGQCGGSPKGQPSETCTTSSTTRVW